MNFHFLVHRKYFAKIQSQLSSVEFLNQPAISLEQNCVRILYFFTCVIPLEIETTAGGEGGLEHAGLEQKKLRTDSPVRNKCNFPPTINKGLSIVKVRSEERDINMQPDRQIGRQNRPVYIHRGLAEQTERETKKHV